MITRFEDLTNEPDNKERRLNQLISQRSASPTTQAHYANTCWGHVGCSSVGWLKSENKLPPVRGLETRHKHRCSFWALFTLQTLQQGMLNLCRNQKSSTIQMLSFRRIVFSGSRHKEKQTLRCSPPISCLVQYLFTTSSSDLHVGESHTACSSSV